MPTAAIRNSTALVLALALAAAPLAAQADTAGTIHSGQAVSSCPSPPLAQARWPLLGLWQISDYRDIMGFKSYASSGDPLWIKATATPGTVCVEFTGYVEGSQAYLLPISADGRTIDATVLAPYGGELRIIIRRPGNEGAHFALYNQPPESAPGRGGANEGGAVGEVESWD